MIEEKVYKLCRSKGIEGVFVLTDSNVDRLTADMFAGEPRLVVEAGEGSKTIAGAEKVWRFLADRRAVRKSVLINLGGGMVSDLGGFAASTFKRGVAHINMPTTLLAAVDAAIGGKTGVNFAGLKNEVGTFALPLDVIPLPGLFGSLPEEEWLSGVGEAVKTGLLESEGLFELATSEAFVLRRDRRVVEEVVGRCAAFKNRIVEEDFREAGHRRILNLGHTWGHALESYMMEKGSPVPHGIAVAYGLRETLRRSRHECGLHADVVERYESFLDKYFPKLEMSETDKKAIERYTLHDKKNTRSGTPNWVLLESIGRPLLH